jgi:tryptophan synthase alpha chain
VNRVIAAFDAKKPVLIPFITGGFPTLQVTREALPALSQAGASIIEIGFPFTDPIADGPIIAESMHDALQRGVTPAAIFEVVREARPRTSAAIVAMVTDSIITRYRRRGPEQFVLEAREAGIDGLIVPDIDLDAAVPLAGLAKANDLTFTLLIAPTTKEDRIARIAALCSGFVYVLARVGITGTQTELDETALRARIEVIRRHTSLPLAVGFGISQPHQVRAVTNIANGAIVGSALVRRMREAAKHGDDATVTAAADFVRELAEPR